MSDRALGHRSPQQTQSRTGLELLQIGPQKETEECGSLNLRHMQLPAKNFGTRTDSAIAEEAIHPLPAYAHHPQALTPLGELEADGNLVHAPLSSSVAGDCHSMLHLFYCRPWSETI